MPRKAIAITLTFLLIISIVIPTFASAPFVNCSVSEGNKVTISWGLNQSRTVKIYRDGLYFITFTNTQNGSFDIKETMAGEHKYRAEAINPGGQDYKRSEVTVIGTGKPSIRLEFINQNGAGTSVERIYNWVKIHNMGSTALELSKLKIRYFYTIDGEPSAAVSDPNNGQQKVEISDARINPNYSFSEDNQIKDVLVKDSVKMSFSKIPIPIEKADYYCDTYFENLPSNGKLYSAYSIKLQPAFNKKNLTNYESIGGSGFIKNYNPTNDYSFDSSASNWKENRNICVYYEDQLIWGNDPLSVAPEAPTMLTAKLEDKAIKLEWLATKGAQTYKVLRSDNIKGNFTIISSNITGTNYLDSSLPNTLEENGKRYYYKVIGVSNGLESKSSNVASVIMYPYVETDLGFLRYNVINKSKSPLIDFALGAYVPITIELKLSGDTTVNPKFSIDEKLVSKAIYGEISQPFKASIINNMGVKAYANSVLIPEKDIDKSKNNEIKIIKSYDKDTIIKLEVVTKISATNQVLNAGIEKYYDKLYKLNFTISADSHVGLVSKDKSLKSILLNIKVSNPNKLN